MKVKDRIKSSIRTQIMGEFFLLISLSIGAFLLLSVWYTRSSLERNSRNNSEELVEQVNFNIESYVDYMENISQIIVGNGNIQDYFFGRDEAAKQAVEQKMREEFQTMLGVHRDISNIILLGDNGRYFINSGGEELNEYARLEQKTWYRKAKEAGKNISLSTSHVQNIVKGQYDWVVTMSRGLQNLKTGQVEGILMIDLNYNEINDLCEAVSLGTRGYVYIVDESGGIVYHPQQQLILSGVKKERLTQIISQGASAVYTDERGEEKIYTPFYSEKTGWTIVGVVYVSELVEGEAVIWVIYFVIAGALGLLAIAMAVFMSGNITKPVKQLEKAMDQAKTGDFTSVQIQVQGNNEIYRLQQNFSRMISQIEDLIQKNVHKEEEKRKIELKALQSQINPHFLYNTLDSIIWMIESEESEKAIQMTSALAHFFRQAIGKSDLYVTLREELEYTKNYLIIQKMRYADKLDYKIEVDERILEHRIIKLVLQPLVENALYHGLKYKASVGMIEIVGYQMQDSIVLKVSDNGIGMEEDFLCHIFEQKKQDGKKHSGIGIGNIRQRMQLYYGEQCEFKIESEKDVGTVVTMVIPYERSGDPNEIPQKGC